MTSLEHVIDGHTLRLEVAASLFDRIRGLAGRDGTAVDGLLIVFPFRFRWWLWMRGMRSGVTILWLAGGKIVGREIRARPRNWREAFTLSRPPCAVDMAIELPIAM